ncbi:MAG: hypothetical protein HQL95_08445 [Magnetococcales bacterium]|nr:hypothetical protein [Magnetococcales bacterium]
MDYSAILDALQHATPFDLYRLQLGIDGMLEQPERIQQLRQQMRPGQEITYLSNRENRLVAATIDAVQRTQLHVTDKETGKRWRIPLYAVNLAGVGVDLKTASARTPLTRNHLRVGESVGFLDRENREIYGVIQQLNPKTASLLTNQGVRWRVGYAWLFKITDGTIIEGNLLDRE